MINEQIMLELKESLMSGVREDFMRVYQKYTRRFILTDRGKHYYKDLKNKYLQGVKMKEKSLRCLLYLHKLQDTYSNSEIQTGNVMIKEIKINLDDQENLAIYEFTFMKFFMEEGYIKDNPDFDSESFEMFSKLLGGLQFEK